MTISGNDASHIYVLMIAQVYVTIIAAALTTVQTFLCGDYRSKCINANKLFPINELLSILDRSRSTSYVVFGLTDLSSVY
jgi:hypothetical protein